MRFSRCFALSVMVSWIGASSLASANGRFPRAQRLIEARGNPDVLVLSATYGILMTADRGGTWRHACELGFAFTIDELDPLVELGADGSMLVQVSRSLNRSDPPFCDFAPVLGGSGSERVVDFAPDRADPSRFLAFMLGRGEGGGVENRLYESLDSGESFAPFGSPLPSDAITFGFTFDVAPSDPERLYASGAAAEDRGVFVRSSDGAETFESVTLPLAVGEYPYIAAVHPTDPDIVYVRTDSWLADEDGVLRANDALLYSDDGGRSFREVHRARAKLFGFALSPDGTQVLIGYGDPVEPSRAVDADALGIFRAEVGEHDFSQIYEGSVSCLSWTQSSLYACTSQVERGFALGVRDDANFELGDAEPFAPLLDLTRVAGPFECPACSSGAVCAAIWSETCAVFGNCETSSASTDECVAGAPATAEAGTGGVGGDTSAGGEGPKSGAPRVGGDGACACRVAGRPTGRSVAPWSVLALVAACRRLLRGRGGLGGMFRRMRTKLR